MPDRWQTPALERIRGFGWYRSEGCRGYRADREYTKDALDRAFSGLLPHPALRRGSETNGLLAADRKPKVDMGAMREINGYEPDSDK
jgi:hypothetical protein